MHKLIFHLTFTGCAIEILITVLMLNYKIFIIQDIGSRTIIFNTKTLLDIRKFFCKGFITIDLTINSTLLL